MSKIYKYTKEQILSDLEKIKDYRKVELHGTDIEFDEMKKLYNKYSDIIKGEEVKRFFNFLVIYPMNSSDEELCRNMRWDSKKLESIKNEIIDFFYEELNKRLEAA